MATLEQIILEQNESSHLDFKTIQYKKERFENFLIDIISMANADSDNSKYIIIGVKADADGKKQFLGIDEAFIDEATFQQLVNENIEPEIRLDYFSLKTKGVVLGIFHLVDCRDRPYMLKKDYGKLKKGDSFIRKGSHQTRLTRKDIDKIFLQVSEKQNQIDDIQIASVINGMKIQEIRPIESFRLPSDVVAEEISQILKEKEESLAKAKHLAQLIDRDIPQIGGTPYRHRSTKTLRENLAHVQETYKDDDLYYLFEKKSFKLNFELINSASAYLEDASIQIEVDEIDGLIVSSRIINEPDHSSWIYRINRPIVPTVLDNMHYPSVKTQNGKCKIFDSIGNLKHHIPAMAFKTPIRFILFPKYKPDYLVFKVKIFGKFLRKPLEKSIELKIIRT